MPLNYKSEAVSECSDLAQQLVQQNLDINVILGGGEQHFYPREMPLPGDNKDGDGRGSRLDRTNLVDLWLAKQQLRGRKAQYLNRADNFYKVASTTQADYLLGEFWNAYFLLRVSFTNCLLRKHSIKSAFC